MKPNVAHLLTVAAAVVTGISPVYGAGTLRFDELPSQPVDGLGIGGVSFGFELGGASSLDATYNVDLGLGSTQFLSDPVLEGDATGVLTLIFNDPIIELSFGLGFLAFADLTPAALVDVYDEGGLLLDSLGLDTLADAAYGITEGLFGWTSAGTEASRIVVDFEDQGGRFALDNLTFNAIPEPGTVISGLAIGALALATRLRRRRA